MPQSPQNDTQRLFNEKISAESSAQNKDTAREAEPTRACRQDGLSPCSSTLSRSTWEDLRAAGSSRRSRDACARRSPRPWCGGHRV